MKEQSNSKLIRWLQTFGKVYSFTAVMLLNLFIFFLIAEFGYRIVRDKGVFTLPTLIQPAQVPYDYLNRAPYYGTLDNPNQMWRDVFTITGQPQYEPYVIWRSRPFESDLVNVDENSLRVTTDSDCTDDSNYTVFTFGGSTMWGFGSPDDGTIPSHLARMLTDINDGPVCVRNLGDVGYNSTQSLNQLIKELQNGDIPDLVIFYDGVNEVSAPYYNGFPNSHFNQQLIQDVFDYIYVGRQDTHFFKEFLASTFHILNRVLRGTFPQPDPNPEEPDIDVATLSADIAQVYLTNYRIVRHMADEFGFEVGFFWQPVLILDEKPLAPGEQLTRDGFAKLETFTALYAATYAEVEAIADDYDRLFFVADVFRDLEAHVWADTNHLTPQGNAIIAATMLERLNLLDG